MLRLRRDLTRHPRARAAGCSFRGSAATPTTRSPKTGHIDPYRRISCGRGVDQSDRADRRRRQARGRRSRATARASGVSTGRDRGSDQTRTSASSPSRGLRRRAPTSRPAGSMDGGAPCLWARDAVLSHRSAGEAWGLISTRRSAIEMTQAQAAGERAPGIVAHVGRLPGDERTEVDGIPVTSVAADVVRSGGVLDSEAGSSGR